MQKLSVVILNYNGKGYLQKFLPSVIQYSDGHEVVVIDNASTDGSIPYLKSHFPEVRLILLDQNLGYSGGYNEGLKQIESTYCVLLNSDVAVTPQWVGPVLRLMEKNKNIAACQPKVKDFNKKDYFEYAGASGGQLDILGYPFCRGRLFQTLEKDEGQYNDHQHVFWASGSCLFVRKASFFEVGGLDTDFFAHMEEIDLCWRFWNHGMEVAVCPESTIYHVGGGTLEKASPHKTYLNFRNGLSMLVKNETTGNLLWKLPVRSILDDVAFFVFWKNSGFKHAVAILRAKLDFLKHIFKTIKKRKAIPHRKLPHIRYHRSVTVDYYLKGKRKFSELTNNNY